MYEQSVKEEFLQAWNETKDEAVSNYHELPDRFSKVLYVTMLTTTVGAILYAITIPFRVIWKLVK